ncbi:DUF4157 domain-containing protein [Myxococcus sp. K15C18031901]|uniref:eCIS core domain-containing protein n=1 Tax=Myxococcus dinghuensis TaxID=2906761 RepID=UPI0020A6F70F|nr:DUF4157 domain-containing protein [Myxococcus dinghuensis]MCP3099888.1 DUF4157 domain-containing protein [Myxococcus dinghuensis]
MAPPVRIEGSRTTAYRRPEEDVAPKRTAKPAESPKAVAAPIKDEFVLPTGPTAPKELLKTFQDAAAKLAGTPLSSEQKKDLEGIFGDSVNLDDVRVVKGPAEIFDHLPRHVPAVTLGNKVVVNPKDFPPSKDLLAHEATHVWQYQNHGMDYAAKALVAQNAGDGYDWKKGVAEGKKWGDLNPEQQGQLIQDAYAEGYFDGKRPITLGGKDYTSFIDESVKQMRAGKGDPDWDFSKVTEKVEDVVEGAKDAAGKAWEKVKEPFIAAREGLKDLANPRRWF